MLSKKDKAYFESLVKTLNLDDINELNNIVSRQKNNYFADLIIRLETLKGEGRRIAENISVIKSELEAEATRLKLEGNIKQSREFYNLINETDTHVPLMHSIEFVHESPFLKDLCSGDTVSFGQYTQGIEETSIAPILWTVLNTDGNQALLLSKYCMECGPFNNVKKPVAWTASALFSWLNNDFINSFSNEERSLLVSQDTALISILSYDEICKYFNSDEQRSCYGTIHALKSANHFIDSTKVSYWIKDDITNASHASVITPLGSMNNNTAVNDSTISIRPVVKVRFK